MESKRDPLRKLRTFVSSRCHLAVHRPIVVRSEGYALSIALGSLWLAGTSPSHSGQSPLSRITGIRSRIVPSKSFAAVVIMVQDRI